MITPTSGEVTLAQLEQIWRGNDVIDLHSNNKAPVEAAAEFVCEAAFAAAGLSSVILGQKRDLP